MTWLALTGCERPNIHSLVAIHQSECVTCHQADYDATTSPRHEGLFATTCADCHNERSWSPATGAGAHEWFPLTEGHANRECGDCHTVGYAAGETPTDCVGCHRRDYDRSPYPGHNVFPTVCTDCHTTTAWLPSSFAHEWELTGAHLGTTCDGCHTGDPPRYEGTPTECVDCHRADYDRSTFQDHDSFPLTCIDCHTTASWRGPSFTHPWNLEGAHAWAPCSGCHTGDPPRYEGTPRECVSCHQADYDRSVAPGHNIFPTTCLDCHGQTTWIPSSFLHPFTLDGAHIGTRCEGCHTGTPPRFEGTPDQCVDCHRDDYDGATTPPHDGFATTCLDCHTTATWRDADFTHTWPLRGAHNTTPCSYCHTGTPPVYEGTPTDCVGCHRDDHDRSTFPGHATFPLTCADCHTATAWRPSTFSHPWRLTGAHTTAACAGCHTGTPPRYVGTPTACIDCHRADYNGSTFAGHSSFPTTCADCHSTNNWRGATFTHSWPLTGRHSSATCQSCHGNPPVYAGTSRACVNCHRSDYDGATYDGHSTFATTCADCHSTQAWRPSSFSHPWPLEGGHATAACAGCHTGTPPRYVGTPTQCIDCHRSDYNGSTFPGHNTYPTTCADCHTVYTWLGASFSHPFPLNGAHSLTPCASCHTGSPPRYAGTPTQCVGCHRGDYDGSPYPPHPTFGTTCTDCHATSGWTPASSGYHPESRFRISSGRHARPCVPCHENPAASWLGGQNVNCSDGGCHEHSVSRLQDKHSGVRNYPAAPTQYNFCMDCHAR